jgi:hypothetical protein
MGYYNRRTLVKVDMAIIPFDEKGNINKGFRFVGKGAVYFKGNAGKKHLVSDYK